MISKEEIEELKSLLFKDQLTQHGKRKLIEYIEQLENKVREQEENIEDYERILDIFDKREYRKKYLEERRKEEKGLLYPDADEIYKKYYELKEDKQKLIDKLEKRRKQNNDRYGMAIDNDEFPEMYEYSGQVKEDEYILKILKGEKS